MLNQRIGVEAGSNDLLTGSNHNDRIYGDSEDAILTGTQGADVFDGGIGVGTTTIAEFELTQDRLSLVGTGVQGFSDLTVTQLGDRSSVTYNNGESGFLLLDVSANDLNSTHFLF